MHRFLPALCFVLVAASLSAQEKAPAVKEVDEFLQIDTNALQAKIRKKGYVSGIAAGSPLDKKSGARDHGFGLPIIAFLLRPRGKDDGYPRGAKPHRDLPK